MNHKLSNSLSSTRSCWGSHFRVTFTQFLTKWNLLKYILQFKFYSISVNFTQFLKKFSQNWVKISWKWVRYIKCMKINPSKTHFKSRFDFDGIRVNITLQCFKTIHAWTWESRFKRSWKKLVKSMPAEQKLLQLVSNIPHIHTSHTQIHARVRHGNVFINFLVYF